jgi:hypothetical protein
MGSRIKREVGASLPVNPRTYADIAQTITLICEILAIPDRASMLNVAIEREVNEIGAHSAHCQGAGPSVYSS